MSNGRGCCTSPSCAAPMPMRAWVPSTCRGSGSGPAWLPPMPPTISAITVIIVTEYVENAFEGIFRQCEPSGGFICRSVESMLWRIGEVNVEQEDRNALCPGDKTRLALRHTGALHFGTCGHRRRCPGRSTDRQGSDAAPRGGDRPHDAALL